MSAAPRIRVCADMTEIVRGHVWSWTLVAPNGRAVAASAKVHRSADDAMRAADRAQRAFRGAAPSQTRDPRWARLQGVADTTDDRVRWERPL